jgi:PPK2 family polyphosphate:nucleotide phosphotransferase
MGATILASDILKHYRVTTGSGFKLSRFDPADRCGLDIEKDDAKTLLADGVKQLSGLQERLYAEHQWAVLIVLQGLDAAGKDGVIKHVMSGVNPQGCEVHPFKQPSTLELDHDFLWRATVALPRRGHIGIFNRSYYEEVLVVRVHKEILDHQGLPPKLITENIWAERYQDINDFERHLARNGTAIIKVFLNVSKTEQQKRLLERIDDPAKQYKFNAGDIGERNLWDQYQAAYEEMISGTATETAPWYVVPADHKWFARIVVAAAIVEKLEAINPQFPTLSEEQLRALSGIRAGLIAD